MQFYGLRRSEAVVLKWSAINFDNDYLYINHTVVQVSGCANKLVEGKLVAKDRTKSIYINRKLLLYKRVKNALLEKKRQTELNANGMDLKAIGEFLGHGNLSTTKRYSHPDDRIKQNVANTYETLIHNVMKEIKETKNPKRFVVKRKVQKVVT